MSILSTSTKFSSEILVYGPANFNIFQYILLLFKYIIIIKTLEIWSKPILFQ